MHGSRQSGIDRAASGSNDSSSFAFFVYRLASVAFAPPLHHRFRRRRQIFGWDTSVDLSSLDNLRRDGYPATPPEQQRIAAYLDASCAAIDAAVAAKRRQLETLDALRKSTIQEPLRSG